MKARMKVAIVIVPALLRLLVSKGFLEKPGPLTENEPVRRHSAQPRAKHR